VKNPVSSFRLCWNGPWILGSEGFFQWGHKSGVQKIA
jgi:hypothetical protein